MEPERGAASTPSVLERLGSAIAETAAAATREARAVATSSYQARISNFKNHLWTVYEYQNQPRKSHS